MTAATPAGSWPSDCNSTTSCVAIGAGGASGCGAGGGGAGGRGVGSTMYVVVMGALPL